MLAVLVSPAGRADVVVQHPSVDTRDYRVVTLPNKLQVLLISDPHADKAAAALDVNVGYYSDPPARPGLAHFLEHMLFLGTDKYPEPGAYRTFISSHGGSHNAFTKAEHTVYFFDIDQDYLEEALDRFAQFFIAPLFDQRFVEREMNAVDSEYRLRIKDDRRRVAQVDKETANPAHPFSKFSVGALDSLGDHEEDKIRTTLIDFYRENYSANRMTAVVLGAEPLGELERMVTPRFKRIKNTQTDAPRIDAPIYKNDQKQIRIDVVPLKDQRELHLDFAFPWKPDYRLAKPARMISHLLGHEGNGSLHALFKSHTWIEGLMVGSRKVSDREAVMAIHIVLTEEGFEQVEAITGLVFQYIRLIEKRGLNDWIYQEMERASTLNFRFREPHGVGREVVALAANLHEYPPELVIRGPFHFAGYDSEAVRDILSQLVPNNMRMTVVAPELPTEQRDPWYDTAYRVRPIPDGLAERWLQEPIDPHLAIPAENIFLPESAGLKEPRAPSAKPVKLVERPGLTVWHKQDDEFKVPKADIVVKVDSPEAADTPLHTVMSGLYLGITRDALNAYAYPARLAGLHYNFFKTQSGFGFSLSGYDEKQALLIDIIVDQLLGLDKLDPAVLADSFKVNKTQSIKAWKNRRLREPYRQAIGHLDNLLYNRRWPPETLMTVAEAIDLEDLKSYVPRLLSRVHIEVLTHGNLSPEEAADLGREVSDRWLKAGRPAGPIPRGATRLERGTDYLQTLAIDHEDSAVVTYYQAPDASIESAARVLLLGHMLEAPFFNELRTAQQLGYVVHVGATFTVRVPGLRFIVQSPVAGPAFLLNRIDEFMAGFRGGLAAMGSKEFNQHKQGLLTLLRKRDKSLNERSQRYRHNLALKYYEFDRREKMARAVERLKPTHLMDFLQSLTGADTRRRIVVQSAGNSHRDEDLSSADGFVSVDDPTAFKKSLPTFEL